MNKKKKNPLNELPYAKRLAVDRVNEKWIGVWKNIKEITSRPIDNTNVGLISVLCNYIYDEIRAGMTEENMVLWLLRANYFSDSEQDTE